jgi:class 3 adenylate cyclase
MFVDLVGSTELSTLLDPEDLRNVILDYQVAATREIKTFDGFITWGMAYWLISVGRGLMRTMLKEQFEQGWLQMLRLLH